MRIVPKILFVDDDKFFLEFYRSELAQYNVNTEFALDGEQGLNMAKEIKPDVILLDVILPKKDGFEILDELKKDDSTKDIPVIVITGLNSQADLDKLTKLGAIKIFNKLTNLPKDVAKYIQSLIENKDDIKEKMVSVKEKVSLSKEQVSSIFSESLKEVEVSLKKLFDKNTNLEDFNVSLIPNSIFRKNVRELSEDPGTVFIYSKIKAKSSGIAVLSMKRNDTLSLIRLIEKGIVGKELGLKLSDKAIEEFFNIIINAFLTKLSNSVPGNLIMLPPKVAGPESMLKILDSDEFKRDNNQLVVFLQEAYMIEELDLNFSIFVIFGGGLFNKKND